MKISSRNYIMGKFLNMRKPQEFIVYPRKEGDTTVKVQSDKSIGIFDITTGVGRLNTKGKYFVHLESGVPFTFPKEFVEQVLAEKVLMPGESIIIG